MLTIANVIAHTARFYDLTPEALTGKERYRNITHARHIAMYLVRHLVDGVSYPDIGRGFGFRDHTTVMHACAKVSELVRASERVRGQVEILQARILERAAPKPRILATFAEQLHEAMREVG